jgi:hypothetical protein
VTDKMPTLDSSLADLPTKQWLHQVEQIADEDGYLQPLGKRHHAIFMEEGATLLVSFETLQGIQALSELGQPLGWDMLKQLGWSSLCVTSDGDTWFRDPSVYAYFDRLIDDGFFDEFDQVIFYGAGPCAYAAAAYSVASPGATVIAIQPQATLDPRLTEWDNRFTDMRIHDFSTRYGYAPDMLEAAERAYVFYDPREKLDAMHAALFTRPNVTKLRMRFMGDALQTDLLEMDIWATILEAAATDELTENHFAKLYRARRDYRPYLRNMLDALEGEERKHLIELLCVNVNSRMRMRRFRATLRDLHRDDPEDQD